MHEPVYKILELTGTSKTDMEGAIQNAISKASETLRNLKWFEIVQVRGDIDNDRVAYWQVSLKIGFNIEDKEKKEEPVRKEEAKKSAGAAKYRCKVCGYIYEPEKGDPTQGIKPGTSFEALPDTWKCPECGVSKDEFEKI